MRHEVIRDIITIPKRPHEIIRGIITADVIPAQMPQFRREQKGFRNTKISDGKQGNDFLPLGSSKPPRISRTTLAMLALIRQILRV